MSTALAEDRLWAAIGEPSRRRLLDVLLVEGEATPTGLATQLPYSRQAVAKHLAVLERVGLVEPRREGREVRYSVQAGRLEEAIRLMSKVASTWDGRLLAIKRIAEQIHREETASRASNRSPR
ncbi:MAG TPA: metalloregulator ArsR/SmtB family transcription factor [Solirubrobacteraceae bacterium]|jgi:DNA-binding transcriptional ArsR family regulator|nr:metalloregulator ArsR/SmtB family transcription factor [Solirubrobacteraceae bacterium]